MGRTPGNQHGPRGPRKSKLEHLDGTAFATRSIEDLFPYNREFGELYEAADKYTRPLTDDELALGTGSSPATWQSLERFASHDVEGEAKWVLVRVEEILDNAIYKCQCYNTLDDKLRLGQRRYLPVYEDTKGREKYTTSPHRAWSKYIMNFPIKQLRYHPFE